MIAHPDLIFYVITTRFFNSSTEFHVSEYDKLERMDPPRIELGAPDCKSGVLPLDYGPLI